MTTDHAPGEATVTLPVSMLRRWADTLEGGSRYDTDPGFETAVVAEAIRAVLADTLDSSPDPEGAVATEVAPDSDTADAWVPTGDEVLCAEEGCHHPLYQHTGRAGRCVEGKQKDTAAWRCDCRGFVSDSDTARETERCMSVCLVCEDQYGLPHVEPHETLDEQAKWVDEHQQSYGADHSPWFVSGWTAARAAAQRARDKRAER